jgi:hypothetical protein
VTGEYLKGARKYVLDALRQDAQSKMCKFGLIALEQFQERLSADPSFAAQIANIDAVVR